MDFNAHQITCSLLFMDLIKVSGHGRMAVHQEETT
jgi:hypothetical protein